MAERRYDCCSVSSSISNWQEKILKRYGLSEYKWWRDYNKSVVFFGMYRPSDYLKFLWHQGEKTIHWCGSDILQVGWHYRWMSKIKSNHICENEIQHYILKLMLRPQSVEIKYTFLSNPDEFPIFYRQSNTPEVFTHINKDAETESGFFTLERMAQRLPRMRFHIYGKVAQRRCGNNIIFHGLVPEEQFNREIRQYHGSLRMHEFDGFAETTAKSVLMGQYPISRIRYPYIDTYKDEDELIELLQGLKNKKEPNYKARNYYLEQFKI